jgi:hypothetical protein
MSEQNNEDWYWLDEIPLGTDPLEVLYELQEEIRRNTFPLDGYVQLLESSDLSKLSEDDLKKYFEVSRNAFKQLHTFREKVRNYIKKRVERTNNQDNILE